MERPESPPNRHMDLRETSFRAGVINQQGYIDYLAISLPCQDKTGGLTGKTCRRQFKRIVLLSQDVKNILNKTQKEQIIMGKISKTVYVKILNFYRIKS